MKVTFYSSKKQREIEAEVIELRKYSVRLRLENGREIVKKNKQVFFVEVLNA